MIFSLLFCFFFLYNCIWFCNRCCYLFPIFQRLEFRRIVNIFDKYFKRDIIFQLSLFHFYPQRHVLSISWDSSFRWNRDEFSHRVAA